MSQPIHTPGPLEFLEAGRTEQGINRGSLLTITEAGGARNDVANVYSADDSTVSITREEAIGHARLLTAAHNAFVTAAQRRGCNAVELAERMQNAEIAELVEALDQLKTASCGIAGCLEADAPPLFRYFERSVERARAILAKVQGGVS